MNNQTTLFLHNSMGNELQQFKTREPNKAKVFTCGPSIYQQPHIGNYRTYAYQDILVRYLEYLGYNVKRSMNFTDIEDKAIKQAIINGHNDLTETTGPAKQAFYQDLEKLNIIRPIILGATETVPGAIALIEDLIEKGFAYQGKNGNVYFDATKIKGPLRPLYDSYHKTTSKLPKKVREFHMDGGYPGENRNLGNFILWHNLEGKKTIKNTTWNSPWGKGHSGWNVQDPAIIQIALGDQVDIACGGIDNMTRHHDYNINVMEASTGKDYANYHLHGAHLLVDGQKMSKSVGNILYPDNLIENGLKGEEIRFFLIADKHYRQTSNFTTEATADSTAKLYELRCRLHFATHNWREQETGFAERLTAAFESNMNNDLSVAKAVDAMQAAIEELPAISGKEAMKCYDAVRKIESVLQIGLARYSHKTA